MNHEDLSTIVSRQTREADLVEKMNDGRLQCLACGHKCPIPEGKSGVCQVRFHRKGKLFAPWGYVAGLQDDPIEKKPFFHALPGSRALSFGMLGCDFHCSYCQNWMTSQTLRDAEAIIRPTTVSLEQILEAGLRSGCQSVISTYNEPLITSEWAVAIFKKAKSKNLVTGYVSNGNGTPEVLSYIKPWTDLYKVDLKTFNDKHYRELGGSLQIVLDTICQLNEMNFWIEIVTLIVPGFNDSETELKSIARFIASVSRDIPWHVTAFHQDYKMREPRNTTCEDLTRAVAIGREAGLRYIYSGNLPGGVGEGENTYCHECGTLLIQRLGFQILENHLTSSQGRCHQCGCLIPGRWI